MNPMNVRIHVKIESLKDLSDILVRLAEVNRELKKNHLDVVVNVEVELH